MSNALETLEQKKLDSLKFVTPEVRNFIDEGEFKRAITELTYFINNEKSLDAQHKEKMIEWSLPYIRKADLSKADVEQYIERISKYL